MHCQRCGRAMTPSEAAELASQADRFDLAAPVQQCGMIWYCKSCYPIVVEAATNAMKRKTAAGDERPPREIGGLFPLLQ